MAASRGRSGLGALDCLEECGRVSIFVYVYACSKYLDELRICCCVDGLRRKIDLIGLKFWEGSL